MDNKWKKLTIKEETINIDGLDIVIKGLTFKEFGNLLAYNERNDKVGAANYLLFTVFRKNMPVDGIDAMSDQDIMEYIEGLSTETATKIIPIVQKLSGFESDKKN